MIHQKSTKFPAAVIRTGNQSKMYPKNRPPIQGLFSRLLVRVQKNSDGNLIAINLNSGDVLKAEKVARKFISKPYIQGGNLFVVKNGSIIQYD